MAQHVFTTEELKARRQDVRHLIANLTQDGYGDTRREARDLHNLRLERAELSHFIYNAVKGN